MVIAHRLQWKSCLWEALNQVLVIFDYNYVSLGTSDMVKGGVCSLQPPLLLLPHIVIGFVGRPEASCARKRRQPVKQWGCVLLSFLLPSMTLMKGLRSAVAPLKQELVVSDKVWKMRHCRHGGSKGQRQRLIFLRDHTQRKTRWRLRSAKPFLYLPFVHFYVESSRDE